VGQGMHSGIPYERKVAVGAGTGKWQAWGSDRKRERSAK